MVTHNLKVSRRSYKKISKGLAFISLEDSEWIYQMGDRLEITCRSGIFKWGSSEVLQRNIVKVGVIRGLSIKYDIVRLTVSVPFTKSI